MLTKLIGAIISQSMCVIMLYTFNLYSDVCPLYLNNTGDIFLKRKKKVGADKIPIHFTRFCVIVRQIKLLFCKWLVPYR